MSRTSVENGHNIFSLTLVADLSDVQQNITGILRAQLTRSPRCGERIEIQQATLVPALPNSSAMVHLHYERWICPPGSSGPTELANDDGTLEVKLTPSLGQNAALSFVSEITRVEAAGFLRNALRSGALGETLRDQIAAALLSILQQCADQKTALPAVAKESVTLQRCNSRAPAPHR